MAKVRGNFVAVRPRVIEQRRGGAPVTAYQCAYIPAQDEHNFPAVINVSLEVFGLLQSKAPGESVEFAYIETPPYGDRLVIQVA